MRRISPALFLLIIFTVQSTYSAGSSDGPADLAVSSDPAVSAPAISELRTRGQDGLDEFIAFHRKRIDAYVRDGSTDGAWLRIANALDTIAMQKDAYASGLYWYTDFQLAKDESRRSGKPMISLRLLGNLDEEYSCANSRFFRSILYTDPRIAEHLRKNYVLHWKSVRPAPLMTIDFGDGRKIVRTVTGNSIHYFLDSSGNVIDGLPGLYSPDAFYGYLVRINALVSQADYGDDVRIDWQTRNRTGLAVGFRSDLRKSGAPIPKSADQATSEGDNASAGSREVPSALIAAPVAVTKAAVEMPALSESALGEEAPPADTELEAWRRIADLYPLPAFSGETTKFILRKIRSGPGARDAGSGKMLKNLGRYVIIDTLKNEYQLHPRIYDLIRSVQAGELDALNERVYSELFLTPSSDIWLGLYSPDIYSAIENNGVVR